MNKELYLSRFTPSLLDAETLEAIFVQREKLAGRLVDLIHESTMTGNKHYMLLIGPRGIGKTHLVSLVYHRVLGRNELQDHLRIAWLREEECVTSFVDFLQTILGVLQERHHDDDLKRGYEQLVNLSIQEAESRAEQLLLEFLKGKTLLVIAENLDDIFHGLAKEGQEKLRAFIQNNPVFTILATSQSLFSGVSVRTSPFYGFFDTHHLQGLSFEDAVTMMAKIARHQDNEELATLLQKPHGRFRVRAVHHLAGGNPRVYVIFSQLLTCQSLDELVEPVLRTLDDLTPYYQERIRHLSAQQRKIVDYFCQQRHAVSVSDIAKHSRVTHQTASSQLKKLRDMGYVCNHQVGRESYYELREPLMRLSRDVKRFRGESIRLLISFLRNWYSHAELSKRLGSFRSKASVEREDIRRAMETVVQEPDDPRLSACLRDYERDYEAGDFTSALEVAEELLEARGFSSDWMKHAKCLRKQNRLEEAEQSEKKALETTPDTAESWRDRSIVLTDRECYEEALICVDTARELGLDDADVWRQRGIILDELGRYKEALAADEKAIQRGPHDARNWRNHAAGLEAMNRLDEALASYDKAIDIDPTDAITWRDRGDILDTLNRAIEALTSYDKAIELDPNDPNTWRTRAYLLDELTLYGEALNSYDRAIQLDAKDPIPRLSRAALLGQLGRQEEALASYDKTAELHPEEELVWIQRAEYLDSIGRFREALASVEKALSIDPGDLEALQDCAIFLYRLGKREESLKTLDRLLEADQDNSSAWSNQAVALSSLGRHEEALASFDRSLELTSGEFDFHVISNRAVVLTMLGPWDEGIDTLDEALRRFAEEGGVDAECEVAIVRNMLIRTQDVATWRKHVTIWIELFEKHGVLSALGQGLARSISTLGISWIGNETARAWRDLWHELGAEHPELNIPLRLLDAAVRYRAKPDVRILLGLPIEERKLLKPLLGLTEESDKDAIAAMRT